MKYYPHHIGDFDRATRYLTRIERSIYRDMIELYYDTEEQLPLDISKICRKVIAHSDEEVAAVEQVLNDFFTKTPTGWYHDRCEEEIEAYRKNNSQKSNAGKASAAAKAQKKQRAINGLTTAVEQPLNGCVTDEERHLYGIPTNQEPSTVNHEPLEKKEKSAHEVFENPPPEPEPAYAKTDIQQPHTDSRAMFEMTSDWQPTDSIKPLLGRAGLPTDVSKLDQSRIGDFVNHWFGKPDRKTADSWNGLLVGWLKRTQHDKPKAAAGQSQPQKPDQPAKPKYDDPSHRPFKRDEPSPGLSPGKLEELKQKARDMGIVV